MPYGQMLLLLAAFLLAFKPYGLCKEFRFFQAMPDMGFPPGQTRNTVSFSVRRFMTIETLKPICIFSP